MADMLLAVDQLTNEDRKHFSQAALAGIPASGCGGRSAFQTKQVGIDRMLKSHKVAANPRRGALVRSSYLFGDHKPKNLEMGNSNPVK
jgi:hypothetical protein